MPQRYSDDLRVKLLDAYGRGVGSLSEVAALFGVSHGWAKKIRQRQVRTGDRHAARPQPAPAPKVTPPVTAQVRALWQAAPDATLAELGARLIEAGGPRLSTGSLWGVLGRLGLTRKKRRSRQPSVTARTYKRRAVIGLRG